MSAALAILGVISIITAASIIGGFSGGLLAFGIIAIAAGIDEARP